MDPEFNIDYRTLYEEKEEEYNQLRQEFEDFQGKIQLRYE